MKYTNLISFILYLRFISSSLVLSSFKRIKNMALTLSRAIAIAEIVVSRKSSIIANWNFLTESSNSGFRGVECAFVAVLCRKIKKGEKNERGEKGNDHPALSF